MSNPKALQELLSYLPRRLAVDIANKPAHEIHPQLEEMQAAVIFADIAGFTPLVEKYSQLGSRGTEEFTGLLNTYFGAVIDLVMEWGGDVEKMAGDALVAFWDVPESRDIDLYGVTLQAARCAAEIQQRLSSFKAADDVELNLRIAVVAGDLMALRIGGSEGRWQFLLAGDPMLEIDRILHDAEPGEIVISGASWPYLEKRCTGTPHASGSVILDSAGPSGGRTPLPPVLPPLESFDILSSFVPRSLRKRLAVNQHDWLSELRPVTILFISLDGLICQGQEHLTSVQHAMASIQSILYRYGGSLRQFTMDDKGPVVMALFGLPLHTHEDDAARCLLAALDIQKELSSADLDCRCGITTGAAFCGTVGNDSRRDYAVIASAANLAARLMHSTDSIACDRATALAAAARLSFEEMKPIRLKGHAKPVVSYRPFLARPAATSGHDNLVGREQEIESFTSRLDQLLTTGKGNHILLEGQPGLGKSCILDHVGWLARERGIRVLDGSGDSIDKETPYLAWRRIFSQLYEIDGTTPLQEARKKVEELFIDEPASVKLAPLLNSVLESDFPDNELTSQMRGELRSHNTRNLLTKTLSFQAEKNPLLLIFDDCHWVDTISWSLIAEACQSVEKLMVITAYRPFNDERTEYLERLTGLANAQVIELGELSKEEVASVIGQILGVANVPEPVAIAVLEHSDGNAFFCQELTYSLRDSGIIRIEGGECIVTGKLDNFEFPSTVEKVINGRVDSIAPELQLTLKVASVIGRIFELQSMARIHPIEADRPKLPKYLETLAELDFTPLHHPPPEQRNMFRHAITQEVLYSQLLFSQRCKLHQALAEWLEIKHAAHIERHYATLAHHWKSAEKPGQAFPYFRQAGEAALKGGAYAEAVFFLEEALKCLDSIENELPRDEHARVFRMLGEAELSLGEFETARNRLKRALDVLGRPWPQKTALPVLREVWTQFMHRLGVISKGAQAEIDREESKAVEYLGHIFYFNEENSANVLSNLRGMNRLERLGPSAELASSYVQVAVILSVIGLSGLADRYLALAVKTLPEDAGAANRLMFANYASLITLPRGDWEQSGKILKEMHEYCLQLGDQHMLRYNRSITSIMMFLRGEIGECGKLRQELLEITGEGEKQIRCWAAIEWAEIKELLGEPETALQVIEQAVPLLEDRGSTEKIWLKGLYSRLLLATGKPEDARAEVLEALEIMKANPPTGFYALEGYAAVAEVLLDLAGTAAGGNSVAPAKPVRQAAACLQRFAKVFPVGKPRALIIKGRVAEAVAAGKGRKSLEQAATTAAKLGMPLEEKRARQYLGQSD